MIKKKIYLEQRNMKPLSIDKKIASKGTILVVDDEFGPENL